MVALQNAQAAKDLEIEQELARLQLERSMFSRLWPLLIPVKRDITLLIAIQCVLVTTIFRATVAHRHGD